MWLFCAISTALIWGLAELFYKKGAHAEEKYSHLKISMFVGFVMGIHAIIMLISTRLNYNPINLIKYIPVSLCYILSMTASYFGIRFIEESISDPIENTSGAIVSILCVLILKDTLNSFAIAGIIAVVIGVVGLGYLEKQNGGAKKRKLSKKKYILAILMPFTYAILDAAGTFLDIYYLDIEKSPLVGITEDNIELVANTSYELTFLIFALAILAFIKIKGEKVELPKQKDKMLAAVCETAGQFTYVYAMSGNGIISAPILSSVCVFSVLFSRIFLKEKLTKKQYAFVAIVILGIILLGTADEL